MTPLLSVKALAEVLHQAQPPSPASIVSALQGAFSYRDFVSLVRRWLPDEAAQILNPHAAEEQQVWAFCGAFSQRYFPIHEMEQYGDITALIPVHTIAIEDYDYHSPSDYDTGHLLLYSLVESLDEGIRTMWLEEAEQQVDRALLGRLPLGGYTAGELHRLLNGTRHEAVAVAAAYFSHTTDNPFLDVAEDWNPEMPDWGDEVVEDLTQEWRAAEAMMKRINERAAWLEQDPTRRFAGLLDFIDRRKQQVVEWRDPDRETPGHDMTLAEGLVQLGFEEVGDGDE